MSIALNWLTVYEGYFCNVKLCMSDSAHVRCSIRVSIHYIVILIFTPSPNIVCILSLVDFISVAIPLNEGSPSQIRTSYRARKYRRETKAGSYADLMLSGRTT